MSSLSGNYAPPPPSTNRLRSQMQAYAKAPERKPKDLGPKIELSREQQEVVRLVIEEKQNVFFTGNAGTGKSLLLRELIQKLLGRYRKDEIAVTASTGIAACNIGGCTLHSFAGLGLANQDADFLARKAVKNRKVADRWRYTKVLIIDEISMIEGDLFERLEQVACKVRQISAPFGGIQLVLCGDFMQLPPVSKTPKFVFETSAWSKCIKQTVKLTHVFRQADQEFVRILNEMRVGSISPEAIATLNSLSRPLKFNDGIEPTNLFAVRIQVDQENQRRLDALPGETVTFQSIDTGEVEKLKDINAHPVLHLKVGAQVMLIKNLDTSLVNGSMGKVVAFQESEGEKFPVVEFLEGRTMMLERESWEVEGPNHAVVATRTQIPVILAYAMSIHKSQGQTLQRVKVDLGRVFEKGQAYVALSRAVSMEGLQVLNFSAAKVQVHKKVVEFDSRLPVVNFN